MKKPYRPCVVAVIMNQDGLILVGERADAPGAWQLPQGGVDTGETPREALLREVYEETGASVQEVIHQSKKTYTYDFPENFAAKIAQEWAGQKQTWFVCAVDSEPDPARAVDKEFIRFVWMRAEEILNQVIDFKKQVYQEALHDLKPYL